MKKDSRLTRLSQNLRKNATPEENTLWYQYLRRHPVQFRRQHPIGPYIVDFYCAKARLVIELDGGQHFEPEARKKDLSRTAYLEQEGLAVLRFSNGDIHKNLRGVCQAIDLAIAARI